MNVRRPLLLVALLASLALALASAPGVSAASPAARSPLAPPSGRNAAYPTPTVLKVDALRNFAIGEDVIVTAHLSTDGGTPLARQMIRVFSYKNRVAQGLTDATGTAQIRLNFNFYPGDYDLLVAYNGSELDALTSASVSTWLTIVPGDLEVQTVPPMEGVQFKFDGEIRRTDSNGIVHFGVNHIGGYHIEVVPPAPSAAEKVRVLFDRWNNNDVSTYHEFKYPVHRPLQAGFLISYPVRLEFTDKENQPVDPARISVARVRTAGTFYTLKDLGDAWLPTNSILHRVGGFLESKQATYYLDNVTIAGANVVNQGQQRFQVSPNSTWWIQLFLYSARFTARDALFRNPIGTGILLEYPDGARREIAFDPADPVIELDSLPRGIYHASVKGTQGLEPRIPLSLSRKRDFELLVVSRADMAVLFGVPAFIVIMLLLIGRTDLFLWLTPRRRTTS